MRTIETARVPVIKLLSKTERLPTDITFIDQKFATASSVSENHLHHNGLAARDLVRNLLKQSPFLRPLVLILKTFMHERCLNSPYTGGLSSYCLVLMVHSFLLRFGNPNDPHKPKTLSVLLLQFLEYYGKMFDYTRMGVTVRGKGG